MSTSAGATALERLKLQRPPDGHRRIVGAFCRRVLRIAPCPPHAPLPAALDYRRACFIVRDANRQALAYVYCEEEPGRRAAAKLLTRTRRGAPPTSPSCPSCFVSPTFPTQAPRRAFSGRRRNTRQLRAGELPSPPQGQRRGQKRKRQRRRAREPSSWSHPLFES